LPLFLTSFFQQQFCREDDIMAFGRHVHAPSKSKSEMEATSTSKDIASRTSSLLRPKTLKRETRFWARGTGIVTLWSSFAVLCTPFTIFILIGVVVFAQREPYVGLEDIRHICRMTIFGAGIFEVNAAFGSFTYIHAKYLDAAWNLVVGRGLQAMAAWICYKVFALGLLRVTEESKVSLELYIATALHPTRLSTAWRYLRGLAASRSARERAILA
jgi:hypothetical protein